MKKLILFELRKLSRAKSLYICFGLCLLTVLLTIGLLFAGLVVSRAELMQAGVETGAIDEMMKSSSANDIMVSVYTMASFSSIFGIFIAIFLCDDYSQSTIKNVYSHGFTRTEVFFAKIVVVGIVTTAAYIVLLIYGFLMGLIFFKNVGEFYNAAIYLEQYLYLLAFMAFVAFLAFAFKKLAVVIVLMIFGPGLVLTFLSIINFVIGSNSFDIARYWFGNYELIISTAQTAGSIVATIIGSVVYCAGFVALGWVVNRKHSI